MSRHDKVAPLTAQELADEIKVIESIAVPSSLELRRLRNLKREVTKRSLQGRRNIQVLLSKFQLEKIEQDSIENAVSMQECVRHALDIYYSREELSGQLLSRIESLETRLAHLEIKTVGVLAAPIEKLPPQKIRTEVR